MNFIKDNSVQEHADSVVWQVKKDPDKLFVGWSGIIGFMAFFSVALFGVDWTPIRISFTASIIYSIFIAVNLIRATFGIQYATVVRLESKLTFRLGYPYDLRNPDPLFYSSVFPSIRSKEVTRAV
ncbi:MAG: hypothetical protein AAF483_22400 [Planctomycetota bacterium]